MVNIFTIVKISQESRGFSHERFNVLYGAYIGIPRFNKYADKKIEESKYGESDWEWGRITINIVCGILIIGFVFCVMEQIFDIVTCYTIPEKMIVDYLTMLMGSE